MSPPDRRTNHSSDLECSQCWGSNRDTEHWAMAIGHFTSLTSSPPMKKHRTKLSCVGVLYVRVSMQGRCQILPCLGEFSGDVPSCLTLPRSLTEVSAIQLEDSAVSTTTEGNSLFMSSVRKSWIARSSLLWLQIVSRSTNVPAEVTVCGWHKLRSYC